MKRTIHEPRVRDPGDRAWRVGGEDYVSAAFEDLDDALDRVWRGELNDAKSALALIHAARSIGALR